MLMFVINLLSRYIQTPTEQHFAATKMVLWFVRGTKHLGIYYKRNGNKTLVAYSDSDYAGDHDNQWSTLGYVFYFFYVVLQLHGHLRGNQL